MTTRERAGSCYGRETCGDLATGYRASGLVLRPFAVIANGSNHSRKDGKRPNEGFRLDQMVCNRGDH
jgi:hypothetical protein